ncbi:MAG: hypothetical protein U0Q15_17145 [Kineosporiaceae bacterium]
MRVPRLAALLAVPALLLGLTACGDQAARPAARQDPASFPAVTVDQASDVVEAVDEAVVAATTKRDVRLAGKRLTGPAADVFAARARKDTALRRPLPQAAPARTTRLIVPAGSGWPRAVLAVSEVAGVSTPVVRVLRSADARQPYALWGEPQMVPGATVPATAGADSGAPALPPTAGGLVLSPQDALARYAAVLTAEGSGRPAADAGRFSADPLRTQTAAASAAERKAVAAVAGFGTAHTPVPASTLAWRTSDGGAIVVGEIRQQTVLTVKPGAGTLRLTGDAAALAPRPEFAQRLVRTTVEIVVLRVPKAGTGTSAVSLIAADRADVGVAGA